MKPGGVPDQFRAARVILKDYVQGKLLFCKAPPGLHQEAFCAFDDSLPYEVEDEDVGMAETFPELTLQSGVHVRGSRVMGVQGSKGKQKKRKEKAKRMYKDSNM